MKLVPFVRLKYETNLKSNELLQRLEKNTAGKDWNINIDKLVDNRILEGQISQNSFLIVMGKYGLTYGKMSLLPVMKGKFKIDAIKGKTIIKIIVRPFSIGLVILSFFYFLVLIGFLVAIHRSDIKLMFFLSLFIIVTYSSVMSKYNRELRTYVNFFENEILLADFEKKC